MPLGTVYQLNAKDFDAKKSSLIAKKVGDDLEVALEEGVIIFDNYFAVCATDFIATTTSNHNSCNHNSGYNPYI
jgi:hypothetical protein